MKSLNYKVGVLKRKFKIKGDFEPGTLISKVNENKIIRNNEQLSKKQTAIRGLI